MRPMRPRIDGRLVLFSSGDNRHMLSNCKVPTTGAARLYGTRMQANLGHTMPDGLFVDSDFKENDRT